MHVFSSRGILVQYWVIEIYLIIEKAVSSLPREVFKIIQRCPSFYFHLTTSYYTIGCNRSFLNLICIRRVHMHSEPETPEEERYIDYRKFVQMLQD